jgi:hypothetical protein
MMCCAVYVDREVLSSHEFRQKCPTPAQEISFKFHISFNQGVVWYLNWMQ